MQAEASTSRTRLLAGGVVLLLIASVGAYVVRSSRSSTTSSDLAGPAPVPAGVTPQTFAPDGLGAHLVGATVMVPSQWTSSPPSSGFQYVIRGESPPAGFVGAAGQGGVVPVTVAQLESARTSFLESRGATIDAATTGTVDNRPAVRLRYKLSAGGLTVSDTEYDIIATSTLAVGAAQHQTIYDVVTVVVGTPVSRPNPALTDWIGSTIKIHS